MNIIPRSHKSAKIAIFSCRKNRVPNEIKTWINQNSVVTGIWTDPEKDKSLAVWSSEQSLVEKRYFSKIAVLYIWVLASTLAHSALEINKALSVTYKLLFILSKNIVPSRSYRYIRDRAFPVTACQLPPPYIYKVWCKQRYIHTFLPKTDKSVASFDRGKSL